MEIGIKITPFMLSINGYSVLCFLFIQELRPVYFSIYFIDEFHVVSNICSSLYI